LQIAICYRHLFILHIHIYPLAFQEIPGIPGIAKG
jgi:hypothetical protein